MIGRLVDRERAALLAEGADQALVDDAVRILRETALGDRLPAFLTTEAYARHLVRVAAFTAREAAGAAGAAGRRSAPARRASTAR
ncbi:hypothetical protein GCM10025734_71050 [Kitasatospora paranensis]